MVLAEKSHTGYSLKRIIGGQEVYPSEAEAPLLERIGRIPVKIHDDDNGGFKGVTFYPRGRIATFRRFIDRQRRLIAHQVTKEN